MNDIPEMVCSITPSLMIILSEFLGRLHPVFVHLPIGILMLGCFFQWLVLNRRFEHLQSAIPLVLFLGMLGAVISCITGIVLFQSGDYEKEIAGPHQWGGIAVAIVSIGLYIMSRVSISPKILRVVSLVLFFMIAVTGHLGGSLTHGSGYLTEGFADQSSAVAIKPIPNVSEALVYQDMVQPLLKARCYNCHGPSKKKGKLRLDNPDFIMLGGKSKNTLVPGKPEESELLERLLLPLDHEDHMPPKEKAQLTKNEIALLHWWTSTGLDFNKKVKDLPADKEMQPVLLAFQSGAVATESISDIPVKEVGRAKDDVVIKLIDAGVIVIPIARNSNYLSVSLVSTQAHPDSILPLLLSIKDQLIWLNAGVPFITDSSAADIGKLTNLTRLYLNDSKISDSAMTTINNLKELRYLNLVNTRVSGNGLSKLNDLKNLKSLYLYNTAVTAADWNRVQKLFPTTTLDSGGYVVPTLAKDTTEVKLETK